MKEKKKSKKFIWEIILVIVIAAVAVVLIAPKVKRSLNNRNLRTIEVNGTKYRQKPDVESYVLMGIDHMDKEDKKYGSPNGDNDLNLIMVVDHKNKTWQLLQINRDTMTDVKMLDFTGNDVGTMFEQLTLAHSYGDGGKISCQNAVDTISSLLWDQKMDGYIATDMKSVNVLTDAVGGVKVHVDDDFSQYDPSLVQGKDVTLTGKNALHYVRGRETVGDQQNTSRQKRQQQFMNAFMKKVSDMNVFQIAGMYFKVKKYITTDISVPAVFDLAIVYKTYKSKPLVTIEGTSRVSEKTGWNEYHLKQSSLQKTILSLYYEKAE